MINHFFLFNILLLAKIFPRINARSPRKSEIKSPINIDGANGTPFLILNSIRNFIFDIQFFQEINIILSKTCCH